MSTYESNTQNDIDCSDDEQLSREELEIRLKLEELKRTQLRRRLDQLEKIAGVEPPERTEKMEDIQNGLLQDLDELDGKEVQR